MKALLFKVQLQWSVRPQLSPSACGRQAVPWAAVSPAHTVTYFNGGRSAKNIPTCRVTVASPLAMDMAPQHIGGARVTVTAVTQMRNAAWTSIAIYRANY